MQGDPEIADPSPEREPEPVPVAGIALTLAGTLLLAVLIVAVEPLRSGIGNAVTGDAADLRHELRGMGAGGVAIALTIALAHAVIWYPAEILDAAVGFVYGFGPGLALAMTGWVLNATLAYAIGRHAARPLLYRFVGRHRFERLERMVEAGGVTLLLGMRLVPVVPFSFFSIVAGAARVNRLTFIWTTAVGYLPLTAIFVFLGSRLETLSATDPALWVGAAVLIALLVVTRHLHRRWRGTEDGAAQPEPET